MRINYVPAIGNFVFLTKTLVRKIRVSHWMIPANVQLDNIIQLINPPRHQYHHTECGFRIKGNTCICMFWFAWVLHGFVRQVRQHLHTLKGNTAEPQMIWDMENAGCFGIILWVATVTLPLLPGTPCSCWLRHVTAFHTTASRLSLAVSLSLSSDPLGQATNLWVTLSIQRSSVCKSFHSLSSDDLTSSCAGSYCVLLLQQCPTLYLVQ